MIAALALVGLAVALGAVGPPRLARSAWTGRAPGLGILAWLALLSTIFSSLVLAGLALAVPNLPRIDEAGGFLHACTRALRDTYATPGGALVSIGGGAAALGLVIRLAFLLGQDFRRLGRERRRQLDALRLVCRQHAEPDVAILAHATPAVYCLPGRRGQVVVTEGALEALTADQLHQVLDHERAHLRAHHHLVLLIADALTAALFRRFGTAPARAHLGALAEMHADDAAMPAGRRSLASALLALSTAQHPVATLSAGGSGVFERVQRLAAPDQPLPRANRVAALAVTGAALLLPLVIALAPAITAAFIDYCPGLN